MSNLFDFAFLNDQMLSMGAVNSVSELQGLLCGYLSGKQAKVGPEAVLDTAAWRTLAVEYMELADFDLEEDRLALFDLLLVKTRNALVDTQLGFQPLLPSDDVGIVRRAEELGAWCTGFLHGLGRSGLEGSDAFSTDAADAIKDLAHIAQISAEVDELEENEVYWFELVEYVKVAVLCVYSELAAKAPKPAGDAGLVH